MRKLSLIILYLMLVMQLDYINAQSIHLQCGDIVEGSFTESSQLLEYSIEMRAGDVLMIQGTSLANRLQFAILVIDPYENGVNCIHAINPILNQLAIRFEDRFPL